MLDIIVDDKYDLKYAIGDIIGSASNGERVDLNCIDVSRVDDMSFLFNCIEVNIDVSKWDVSNVTDMHRMFANSRFNGDISRWDVSNVKDFGGMFYGSDFSQDISNWDMSSADYIKNMFYGTKLVTDISKWNIPVWCDTNGVLKGCDTSALSKKTLDRIMVMYKWAI